MTPFDVYIAYLGLKTHFSDNSKFDFTKYNLKTKASVDSFESRKDKYQFVKLSKHRDPFNYLLANFVDGKYTKWVGELNAQQASENVYLSWLKRKQSLSYIFEQDINRLSDDLDENFAVPDDGSQPLLLQLFAQKKICIETFIILNDIFDFIPRWDKKLSDDFYWSAIKQKCLKYSSFVQYDREKMKKILLKRYRPA